MLLRFIGRTGLGFPGLVLLVWFGMTFAPAVTPRLEIAPPKTKYDAVRLSSAVQSNIVFSLQATTNFLTSDDWKNQLTFPVESFRSIDSLTEVAWVKFAILLDEPVRV
jgi:hypothetical protein